MRKSALWTTIGRLRCTLGGASGTGATAWHRLAAPGPTGPAPKPHGVNRTHITHNITYIGTHSVSFVANRAREHSQTLTETAPPAARASAAATIGCTGHGRGSGDLLAAAAGHHARVDAPEQQKTQAEEGSRGKGVSQSEAF